jgi:hypothetical protein
MGDLAAKVDARGNGVLPFEGSRAWKRSVTADSGTVGP